MSQDLTDLLSARRENMTNKIAYIDANNKAVIYNHIAHALAREYLELLYVNMETGEVIRFNTDWESGVLSEGGREADFFESCKRKAKYYVHPEDLEQFIRAMSWENIKRTLDEKGIFEQIYRRVMNGRVFYVQMRATRMEDDDRILVFSVSDIDGKAQYGSPAVERDRHCLRHVEIPGRG